MRISTLIVLVLSLLAFDNTSSFAQGTRDDYDRAYALPGDWTSLVRNEEVRVRWLTPSFPVYQYQLNDGTSEWRTVDLDTGDVRLAIDMDRVSTQLKKLGINTPHKVSWFDSIGSEDESMEMIFTLESTPGLWIMNIDGSDVHQLEPEDIPDGLSLPRVDVSSSPGGGPRTSVFIINAHDQAIEFFWLDGSGVRHSYAKLKPGQSHRQGTFTNHAWEVVDESGETLGVYLASEKPGMIIATSKPVGEQPMKESNDSTSSSQTNVPNQSPDGRYSIEFDDEQVILVDHQSDSKTTLTQDGKPEKVEYHSIVWAPDSSKFVIMRTEIAPNRIMHIVESSPDEMHPDSLQPELISVEYTKPGDPINQPKPVLFDALNTKQIKIDHSPIGHTWWIDRVQWDRESSAIFYLYNERGHQTLRVIRSDAITGESKVIINETHDAFIDYSSKTYLNILHDTNEIVWMSERSGYNHVYRFNSNTGELINPITQGEWVVRSVESFDTDSNELIVRVMGYYSDQDPYHIHFARVNLDGSGFTMLTHGDGTHRITQSPNNEYYTDRYSRVDLPPVMELRKTEDASLIATLSEADWSMLVEAGWNPPERFVSKARDGETDIWGIIHRPTNFDPSKSYPVIESIYAGPHGQHVPKTFRVWRSSQSLSELGFITVHIDGMGTNWRSRAFHDVAWKNIKDAGFPDRIAWIKSAAITRPWMNLDKVGIYGISAGGQNAMAALIWHNDFYHAAVADCGCHDNRMDKIWWNEQWMGYPIDESYSASSNRDNAHLLEGDLLLTVGELDQNVDPASTMQVVDALIRADKDFDFINFPGLGHGTIGSPYGKRRLYDFFVRSLLEVEPRAESID